MILNRIDYFNDSLEVKEGQEKDIIDYHEGLLPLMLITPQQNQKKAYILSSWLQIQMLMHH